MDMISRAAAIECAIDAIDDWDGGWNPNRETVIRKYFEELPAVDAIPVDWLRKKMQKPLMTCDNPFDYVLSTWQDEQRKETQDDCNYNDE